MQFTPKKSVKRFQQGGPIAADEQIPTEEIPVEGGAEGMQEAPEEAQQQNPLVMLAQGAVQALQSQDCQIAMQVCQGLIQIVQQAMQGQQPPQETTGEPVFRKGGVLSRRIRK